MQTLSVHMQWIRLHCYDEADSIGSAEPYLWAVFFKVDGDSCFVDETFTLRGSTLVFNTLGDHGNLNDHDVDAGDDVAIPAQFGFGHNLRPIPLRVPIGETTEVGGVIGCIVVLLEEDETPESAVAKGHGAFAPAVQQALNDLIPTLNAGHLSPTEEEIEQMTEEVGDAVEGAIKSGTGVLDWISAFGNMDDKIGSAVFTFSTSDLLEGGPSGIVMTQRWDNEGDWEITGQVKVDWSPAEDLGGPPAPPVADAMTMAIAGSAPTEPAVAPASTLGTRLRQPPSIGPGTVVLNTQLSSAPAVASWQENRLDCFARGVDAHLWHRSYDGAGWGDWGDLGGPPVPPVIGGGTMRRAVRVRGLGGVTGPLSDGGQMIASAPGAVSWGPNRIDAFVRGMDRAMWHRYWNGVEWSGWESLGGSLNSAPAVASWGDSRLDCFVEGPSNHLWHKWYEGGWSEWEDLGGILTAAPAAVSWGPGRLDTFVRGTDNHLWHKWYEGGWSEWEDLGGILTAAPAAAARGVNKLDCFVRGTDSRLWLKSWNGTAWGEWSNLGDAISDAPAAISWGSNRIDYFVRGMESHMWHRSWG